MRFLNFIKNLVLSLYSMTVLALFLSVADQPLGRLGYLPLNPTVCALLLLVPFAAWSLFAHLLTKSNRYFIAPLTSNLVPYSSFFLIVAFSLILSVLPGAFWAEGGKWIFLICYGFGISLLALFIPQSTIFPRLFPYCGLVALVLLCWSIYLDIAYPGTFAELGQRPAGFPGNANFAALVAVMLCASSLDYRPRHGLLRNILALDATGAVMVTTMSRSGALNFLFLVTIFAFIRMSESRWNPREVLKVATTTAIMLGVCVGLAVGAVLTGTISEQTRLGRLMNNQQVDDGSAASRLFAVRESLRLIDESPILGHGTGHSRTMRELPHNLYLQQWVNNGVIGVCSLVGFFGVTLLTFIQRRYRPGQALILVAMLGGVFSHNVLDQRCFLLLLGILLGLSSYARSPAIARYASAARWAP